MRPGWTALPVTDLRWSRRRWASCPHRVRASGSRFRAALGAVSGPSSAALRVEEQGGRETPVGTRGMTVSGLAGRRFAGALLTLADVIEFPLDATLSVETGALHLTVLNNTGREISGALLVHNGTVHPVGAVPAGSQRTVNLESSNGRPFPSPGEPVPGSGSALAAELWQQAFTAADRERTVLVGWLAQSPLGVRMLDAGSARAPPAHALVVVRL